MIIVFLKGVEMLLLNKYAQALTIINLPLIVVVVEFSKF